jgi:hypothetical protein
VRQFSLGGFDRFPTVRRLRNYFEGGFVSQQGTQPAPDESMIVSNKNTNRAHKIVSSEVAGMAAAAIDSIVCRTNK